MANELDIYTRCIQLIQAQTAEIPYQRINAFAVGFIEDYNTDNVSKPLNPQYAYSTKMVDGVMSKAYPFLLLKPLTSRAPVNPRAWERYDLHFTLTDLLHYDREGSMTSDAAERELEDVWNDLATLGKSFIRSLKMPELQILSEISMLRIPKGLFSENAVGVEFRLTVRTKECFVITV